MIIGVKGDHYDTDYHYDMDHDKNHYYVFELHKEVDPKTFLSGIGFKYERTAIFENHYLFSIPKDISEEEIEKRISGHYLNPRDGSKDYFTSKIFFYDKQRLKKYVKRVFIPYIKDSIDSADTSNGPGGVPGGPSDAGPGTGPGTPGDGASSNDNSVPGTSGSGTHG